MADTYHLVTLADVDQECHSSHRGEACQRSSRPTKRLLGDTVVFTKRPKIGGEVFGLLFADVLERRRRCRGANVKLAVAFIALSAVAR